MWAVFDQIVLYFGCSLGALCLWGIRRAPAGGTPAPAVWRTTGWGVVALLVLSAGIRGGAWFLVGADEYFRLYTAAAWAREPFFAPADHVFLGGQFYVLGTLFLVLGDMRLAVAATGLLGAALTVHFATRLASRMWERRSAGLFAGLLVASQWVVLWSATNPMAEVFFWPALLAAMNSWLVGWQAHADGHHGQSHPHYLRAAAWVAAGTMFRYEMWYAGIVLGGFLAMRALALLLGRDPRDQQEMLTCLGGCALVALYPAAWMVSSQVHLGPWMGFFENARAEHLRISPPPIDATYMSLFTAYPRMLLEDHGARLGLAACGLAIAPIVGLRRTWPQVLVLVCLALTGMLVSVRGGIGSAHPERLTVFLVLPLLCFAAGPLALLWDHAQPAVRRPLRIAVAAFLLVALATSTARARLTYPNAAGVRPELLAVLTRLEREQDPGRQGLPAIRVRLAESDLGVFHGGHPQDLWMVSHHSRAPRRVFAIPDARALQEQLDNALPGTHLLVRKPRPEVAVPERAELVDDLSLYELWEVGTRQ